LYYYYQIIIINIGISNSVLWSPFLSLDLGQRKFLIMVKPFLSKGAVGSFHFNYYIFLLCKKAA